MFTWFASTWFRPVGLGAMDALPAETRVSLEGKEFSSMSQGEAEQCLGVSAVVPLEVFWEPQGVFNLRSTTASGGCSWRFQGIAVGALFHQKQTPTKINHATGLQLYS